MNPPCETCGTPLVSRGERHDLPDAGTAIKMRSVCPNRDCPAYDRDIVETFTQPWTRPTATE